MRTTVTGEKMEDVYIVTNVSMYNAKRLHGNVKYSIITLIRFIKMRTIVSGTLECAAMKQLSCSIPRSFAIIRDPVTVISNEIIP